MEGTRHPTPGLDPDPPAPDPVRDEGEADGLGDVDLSVPETLWSAAAAVEPEAPPGPVPDAKPARDETAPEPEPEPDLEPEPESERASEPEPEPEPEPDLAGRDESRADLGSTGDYGIDAPGVISTLSYVALGAFGVMLLGALVNAVAVMIVGIVVGVPVACLVLLMVSSSRVGKLRERTRVIRFADLAPDDYVLDVGCGRGLLLVEAAGRLTDGLAVGVDVWSATDQSRNEPSAPLANAVVERVEDRVEVVTGDGRRLPYVDGAFDAVVSSMVLHNFGGAHGPAAAVREIARVLRPGGRLVVVDLRGTRDYARVLRDLGWVQVARSRRVWRLFPPVRYVTATKPSPAATV